MSQPKVAIVTGASGGIGRAIALELGQNGYDVAVHYARNEAKALEVVEELKALGAKAQAFGADIADYTACETLVKDVIQTFGRVDVLVNNAGITNDHLILRMDEAMFSSVIDTNLKGTWHMIKHVTRPMIKQKYGRIINITSVVGEIGNAGQANYAASKAGIRGITQSLAKELGKKNITLNAIAPGFIETAMTDGLASEIKDAYLAQIPLARFGTPEDVAKTVTFLASDGASYITGQTIQVNGGMV